MRGFCASGRTAIYAALVLSAATAGAQEVPLAPSADDVPASPLAEAAMRGDSTTVRALLDEGTLDANAPGRDGTPALHWVVRIGDRDTAQRLVKAGADVNAANRYGVLPLHLAIGNGDAAMTRWLLDAGAAAAMADRAGEPPLLLAARVGEPAVAAALLAHGAAVDTRDAHFGQTPLMVAVRNGHLELAKLLLDAGADVNAQTTAAEPPRFIPPSESPPGLSKGIGIVRAGWPEGRGKRFPAAGAKTALLYATREGHLDVARLLVERGANLELADGNGITPLLNAILNANIFRVNRTGETITSTWRICCSTRGQTSTRWIGTAKRRSGPPSIYAISSSGPRTRRPAFATKRSR
jgi:ankyrin repeat protein